MNLKIGTRGSELALFQARTVERLLRAHAGIACDIVVIRTSGDRLADATLSAIGGKGLFVKEIEDALLGGEIDLAVHSSKDMPAVLPPRLTIGAVLERENPRDAVVLPVSSGAGGGTPSNGIDSLSVEALVARLGAQPRIGTSSVRRTAQIARLLPGAKFLPIRGNLDTRLRKLDEGGYDALVLAAAGLIRLRQQKRISAELPVQACVPSPGQGIIAIEIRRDDARAAEAVAPIDHPTSRAALMAERAVVARLGGGCQMPIGAYADIADDRIKMHSIVLSLDGARALRAVAHGALSDAPAVGTAAADQLIAQGAGDLLAEIERAHASVQGLQP